MSAAFPTEMPPVVVMLPPVSVKCPAVRLAVPAWPPELVIARVLLAIASVAADWLRVSAPIVSFASRATL